MIAEVVEALLRGAAAEFFEVRAETTTPLEIVLAAVMVRDGVNTPVFFVTDKDVRFYP